MRQPLSLKGRALALLAQREQSAMELRRKLMRHAWLEAQSDRSGVGTGPAFGLSLDSADIGTGVDADREADDIASRVEAVIGWLREHDYLSEERFVESRVHARSARFGHARIQRELAQHGLALPPDTAAVLRSSEFERAADVWRRKFGDAPTDATAAAKQARFLIARGFSAEIVRRLVRVGKRPTDAGRASPDD